MCQRMEEAEASAQWLPLQLANTACDLECHSSQSPAHAATDWPFHPILPNQRHRRSARSRHGGCMETDGTGRPLHIKVQDPSLVNWFGLALRAANRFPTFPFATRASICLTAVTTSDRPPSSCFKTCRSHCPGTPDHPRRSRRTACGVSGAPSHRSRHMRIDVQRLHAKLPDASHHADFRHGDITAGPGPLRDVRRVRQRTSEGQYPVLQQPPDQRHQPPGHRW